MGARQLRVAASLTLRRAGRAAVDLDWLFVLVASWALPVVLAQWNWYGYLLSLTFWLVPITVLLGRFARQAVRSPHLGFSRRRRALVWSVVHIVGLGLLLDFWLGPSVLCFDPDRGQQYLLVLPRGIPIEECFFYLLAPVAILLVYAWCDEYWLSVYSPRNEHLLRLDATFRLLDASWSWLAAGVAAILLGIGVKAWKQPTGTFPVYFTYLVIAAFLPALLLLRRVGHLVNWRAFSFTTLYVLGTSALWEATLAVPRRWWGYRADTALGLFVPDWSRDPNWPFPIEAVLVWVCAPFSCILAFEAAKAYQYNPNPSKRARLFGPPKLSGS